MKIESMDRTSRIGYKDNLQNTQSKLTNHEVEDTSGNCINIDCKERAEMQSSSPEQKEIPVEGNPSKEYILSEISKAKEKMNGSTSLEFSYHEATKSVAIKVIDKKTKDVIREIPPEKSLDMLQKMWELAGLLIDERR